MAKEDGVKRGFFFYFGLFMLFLLGIGAVLMLVMMFMPNTSILGIQYFTNSSVTYVDKTTDEAATELNFNDPNFERVEITTNFANVTIQKNWEYKKNGIYFVNQSKGFVTTKGATELKYTVEIKDDETLSISIAEERAFLYFSKEIEVVFQIANEAINPLSGKEIVVKTNSGDINIGGYYSAGPSYDTEIGDLTAESKYGSISMTSYAPEELSNLSLKSDSGDISISKETKTTNMTLNSRTGDISASKIETNSLEITSSKGKIITSEIIGSTEFEIANNYVHTGTITGDVEFTEKLDSADITIDAVTGNLVANNAANADFFIGPIGGTANIGATSGYIKLDSVSGKATITTTSGDIVIGGEVVSCSKLTTKSGDISAKIASNTSDVEISTESGELNLVIPQSFSEMTISNKSGKTDLQLVDGKPYRFIFYNYGKSSALKEFDKIHLNKDQEVESDMTIGTGSQSSDICFHCNGQINFEWN